MIMEISKLLMELQGTLDNSNNKWYMFRCGNCSFLLSKFRGILENFVKANVEIKCKNCKFHSFSGSYDKGSVFYVRGKIYAR